MSQVLAVPRKHSTAARPWLLGAAFLFLGAVFYLAEPLDLTMSTSDFINLDDNDVPTIDRVENNIQAFEEGNTGRQIALVGLAGLGAILLLCPSQSRLRVRGLLPVAALFFLAWSGASVFWSDLPFLTMRKLVVLGCLCLGAVGLAKWLSLREMMFFTLFSTGSLLAAGVAAECALGTFQPWKGAYRFSGLTWPAFSAWNASLFILAALALRRIAGRYRTALGLAALIALGLLLLTKTRASAGALLASGLVYVSLTWPPRRQLIAAIVVCLTCSLGILGAELAGGKPLDGLIDVVNLGRTESASDISGRAGLWADLAPYIAEKPLGGYGYDSFWTPGRLMKVGEDNWGAPDAHNSFINLTLGVGVVGTAAYFLVLLLGLWRARTRYRTTSDIGYVFSCCAIVVLIGNALFVASWLAPVLYSFITMMLIARLGFVAPPGEEGGWAVEACGQSLPAPGEPQEGECNVKPMLVSIVIATYRRPAMLRDAVLSLRGATVPDGVALEIVVIDNDPAGSARSAAEELAPECRASFAVRYFHETRTGLSYARNRGVEESRGEIIAFLDDDVYVSPGWLAAALECLERTGAAAVGGRTLAHWEGEPEPAVRANQRWLVDIDIGERDMQLRGRALPGGGNAAFRREAFAGGLGFSTDLGRIGPVLLSGEDTELFQRLRTAGGTIWHCAGMVVGHRMSGQRVTSAYVVRQKYWFGISYAIIDRKLHGRLYQMTRACGRAAKALLIDLPRWAVSAARCDAEGQLVARCSLAKQCGYVRGALSWAGSTTSGSAERNGQHTAQKNEGRP